MDSLMRTMILLTDVVPLFLDLNCNYSFSLQHDDREFAQIDSIASHHELHSDSIQSYIKIWINIFLFV